MASSGHLEVGQNRRAHTSKPAYKMANKLSAIKIERGSPVVTNVVNTTPVANTVALAPMKSNHNKFCGSTASGSAAGGFTD